MQQRRSVDAYCSFCARMCAHMIVDDDPRTLSCTKCTAFQTLAAPEQRRITA